MASMVQAHSNLASDFPESCRRVSADWLQHSELVATGSWLRRAPACSGLKLMFGAVEVLDHGLVVRHV